MGAALILSALGVDKKNITEDYKATNVYWKEGGKNYAQRMIKAGMSESKVSAILAANPVYLETFLKAIDDKYGSMDNFLTKELELNAEKIERLKRLYLE